MPDISLYCTYGEIDLCPPLRGDPPPMGGRKEANRRGGRGESPTHQAGGKKSPHERRAMTAPEGPPEKPTPLGGVVPPKRWAEVDFPRALNSAPSTPDTFDTLVTGMT